MLWLDHRTLEPFSGGNWCLHMMSMSLKWITFHGLASFCCNLSWNISNSPENKWRQIFSLCTKVKSIWLMKRSPLVYTTSVHQSGSKCGGGRHLNFLSCFSEVQLSSETQQIHQILLDFFLASFTEGSSNISGSNKWHLTAEFPDFSQFLCEDFSVENSSINYFVEILSALRRGNLPKKSTILRFLPEGAHVCLYVCL